MDILGEYTEFVKSLEAEGIEYATCGGLAMAVHGYVRATKDLDFLIRPNIDKKSAIKTIVCSR